MKKKRKKTRYKWILIAAGLIAAALIVCILNVETIKEDKKEERAREYQPEIYVRKDSQGQKIAIIIDDIGHDLSPLNGFLKIDAPITFSILPHCAYSIDAAEKLHLAGREILLHLPMEPHDYPDKDPGPGALFTRMSKEELRRQIDENIKAVPYIVGVNNHMGSKFMEGKDKLNAVFSKLDEEGLFFVDSLTTGNSNGRELAEKTGLRFACRDTFFIDNTRDSTIIVQNFKNLIKKRKQWQTLLLIGHPYPCTISALKEVIPIIRAEGISIVPVSDLIS